MPPVRTMPLLAVTPALAVALTLALALALAGCRSGDDEAAAPRPGSGRGEHRTTSGTPGPAASSAATAAPSSGPSSAPSAASSARHSGGRKTGQLGPRARARSADAHLLDADELPELAPGSSWTVHTTGPERPSHASAVGACHKAALGSIGAVEATRRTFTAPDGAAATQVVARFADSRSAWRAHEVLAAWRAHEVLAAWRDDCEQRLSDASVGPLEPVTVHTGAGASYRATYGARRERRIAGLGILRAGAYVTVVEITAGAGHYPQSWDPARVALRRIARTF